MCPEEYPEKMSLPRTRGGRLERKTKYNLVASELASVPEMSANSPYKNIPGSRQGIERGIERGIGIKQDDLMRRVARSAAVTLNKIDAQDTDLCEFEQLTEAQILYRLRQMIIEEIED